MVMKFIIMTAILLCKIHKLMKVDVVENINARFLKKFTKLWSYITFIICCICISYKDVNMKTIPKQGKNKFNAYEYHSNYSIINRNILTSTFTILG